MRILICDDDLITLKATEMRLRRDGHEIFTAIDGRIAYEYLMQNKVDLIITDMLMPNITGLELIYLVKNTLHLSSAIIVMSSIGLENTVLRAFELGADDYVIKPFSYNELAFRVKLLEKRLILSPIAA